MTPKAILLIAAISLICAIELQANQDIEDLSLESLLDVEISTANKYEQKIGNVPAAVHIISHEEIVEHGYHTISDILLTIPGFYITDDRNYNYVGVRGFGRPSDYSNRILLLIDGHKINDSFYGSMDPGYVMGGINLKSFKRVEIIQGPGSVLYGSGAMFAVINLISNEGKDTDALQVGMSRGSQKTSTADFSFGREFRNGLQLHLAGAISDRAGSDLYFSVFDDPETNNGWAKGADGESYHGVRLGLSYGAFKLHGMVISRLKTIPTAPWNVIFNDDRTTSLDNSSYLEIQYDHDFNAAIKLAVRAYMDEYYYKGVYPYETEEDGETYEYFWWDKNVTLGYGLEGRLIYDVNSQNRVICGVEIIDNPRVRYVEWDLWDLGFQGDFPYSALSVYAQQEYQFTHNLAYTGGLRWDHYSNIGNMFTPRVALVYNLSPSKSFKYISGLAYRAPTVYERSYQDASYGYMSNPDLKRESIRSYDLVYTDRISSNLQLTLNAFRYSLYDIIDQVVEDASEKIIHVNTGMVSSDGIDVKVQLIDQTRMQHFLGFGYNYTFSEQTVRILTNSPRLSIIGGGHYRFPGVMTAGFDLRFETGRKTLSDSRTNPNVVANMRLTHLFMKEKLSLSVYVKNVFNTEYYHPGGWEHTMNVIPQDGRTALLRLQYTLRKGL